MDKLEDVVVYVDSEGRPWSRVTNQQGFYEKFERLPLSKLELEPAKRQDPWGYYGDEPVVYGGEPRGGFFRVKGRPVKRMTWYPQEKRN